MRIIGTIDHPGLKISVFKNDNRLSVKLENGLYEQTYKFGDDDQFRTVADVQKLLDEPFLAQVQLQMQAMHRNRLASLSKHFSPAEAAEFDTII
jgi:hypothetical protein